MRVRHRVQARAVVDVRILGVHVGRGVVGTEMRAADVDAAHAHGARTVDVAAPGVADEEHVVGGQRKELECVRVDARMRFA